MKNIVFHGSPVLFDVPKVMKNHDEFSNTEGYGVYFSYNRETAAQYGRYLYTMKITVPVRSFEGQKLSLKNVCDLLREVSRRTGTSIHRYLLEEELQDLAACLTDGLTAIYDLPHQIQLMLDNCEPFCMLKKAGRNPLPSRWKNASCRCFRLMPLCFQMRG